MKGLTAPAVFEGAIDGPYFLASLERILVPTLRPGDIVIADNLGAHKVRGVEEILAAAGAAMWYLSPYSPDLNAIEICFAKLKAIVRAARCRSIDTLWRSLGACIQRFPPRSAATTFGIATTPVLNDHEIRFKNVEISFQ